MARHNNQSGIAQFVFYAATLALAGLLTYVAGISLFGCWGPVRHVLPDVVRLVADDCVEIAKLHDNGAVESICATVRDLSPVLDTILGKRPVGGTGAPYDGSGLVCVQDKCVTRTELNANFDLIKATRGAR